MDKIVIVDGNSLINRAYFAMRELRNSKGLYTGGVYGLTNMIYNLIDSFEPKYFAVAFDMKGPTFRHKTYENYKGTRKGMPEELAMQLPVIKELLTAMNIEMIELQGYEADDLIGTIATLANSQSVEAHIITGDKDALQLCSELTHVHITKKGVSSLKEYRDEEIMEEWGVNSDRVIDFKGLSGDSSDNIPGIPGVGPKTASKLLAEFDTVENLIMNVDAVSNKRIRGLVEEYSEQALLSKRLATIMTNVPIEFDLSDYLLDMSDIDSIIEVLKKYELTSLLSRFKKESESIKMESCQVADDLQSFIETVKQEKRLVFKSFYDKSLSYDMTLYMLGMKSGDVVYFIEDIDKLEEMAGILEDESIEKVTFDLKAEWLLFMAKAIKLKGQLKDVYISAYLLEPSRKSYDVAELGFEMSSLKIQSEEELLGKGAKKKTFGEIDKQVFQNYVMAQLQAIDLLEPLHDSKMAKEGLIELYKSVEIPLIEVLASIEFEGFTVDLKAIDHLDALITEQIQTIEGTIYELAEETFNINSPKQLGIILFEKLGLKPVKKTKTGYSTSHDNLMKVKDKHPIIDHIIEYRMYSKLKSTYIDGLRAVIDNQHEKVHTSLNQTIAVTGRLSSTEPNLQNIPIRLPFGRKVRQFFIAEEGCTLLDADYSQIELRVLAHLSGDETLINAFKNDLDIHRITASQVFGVPEDQITSLQRSRAKEVNFGIVYGMGDFGLGESLGISRKEAKTYIESYFKTYPKVQSFMDDIIAECKEKGYVTTILGRKRQIPEITHSNFMVRSGAERIARNTPIQGSAADIIKIAMINIYRALEKKDLKSRLILQVHDELIINVHDDELDIVKALLSEAMEEAFELVVPLKIDMNMGNSWYDAK